MLKRFVLTFVANYRKRKKKLIEFGIFNYISNSSGYVLIIVLIITSLLVSVSTEFLIVAQTNINYSIKFSERLQAQTLARSGVDLATFILMADKRGLAQTFLGKKSSDKNVDSYDDVWAIDFPELPLEQGFLKISISDENSKINLSVLSNKVVEKSPYYSITQRFFMNMGLPIDIADAIIDWVDIDDMRFPYGAESADYYLTLEYPYRAKNAQMDSIDELLLIKGITPEIFYGMGGGNYGMEDNLIDNNKGNRSIDMNIFANINQDNLMETIEDMGIAPDDSEIAIGNEKSRRLSDYFRVHGDRSNYLSKINKININTASYRVLSALTDNMTDDIVTEIINRRRIKPFKRVDEVSDLIEDENTRQNILTVQSYIFKIVAIGSINDTNVKICGIYDRDKRKFLYWSEE